MNFIIFLTILVGVTIKTNVTAGIVTDKQPKQSSGKYKF